jgi:nucleotide-binding universal stress UspA family protein
MAGMLDIVIAVDGSENALEAVRHALKLCSANAQIRLHLLNVQPPLPLAVSRFVNHDVIRAFHQEEGQKSLTAARALLDQEKIPYEWYIAVGDVADAIVSYAKDKHCEQILMGTRGLSSLPSLLLGSVATRVLHLADVPVTLIPRKRRK